MQGFIFRTQASKQRFIGNQSLRNDMRLAISRMNGDLRRMKAVVLVEPGKLEIRDVPKPSPKPGEALVKVTSCGICGSDLRYMQGENPWAQHTLGEMRTNPPNIILGHEIVGVIAEVGKDVPKDRIGERVAVLCFQVCGSCEWCSVGMENLCPNTAHLGHGAGWGESEYYYGGMAEYVPVWENHCLSIPESMTDDEAVMLDAVGVAVHAVSLADYEIGESTLVIGAGPLGLCIAQCAIGMGAKPLIISETNQTALSLAKEYGINVCINPKEQDLKEAVLEATGIGAQVVFDTVGLPLEETLPLIARGGKLFLLAVKEKNLSISPMLLSGERKIQTVANFRLDDFPTAIELLSEKAVRMDKIVTHHFQITDALEAFATAENREQTGAIKVVIHP